MSPRAPALLIAATLLGCGAPSTFDAGPGSDSGARLDTGPAAVDSGADDAGAEVDGGGPVDGGGGPVDAGARTFLDAYDIDAEFAEGGDYDPVSHRFFVGSLATGSVHAIDAQDGAERTLFEETAPGTWWTLGMDVDAAGELLYVCALDDVREVEANPDDFDGYVWVFDLGTGERIANIDLGDVSSDATCTDVVVADDGTAYVCDRENPRIYQLSPSFELSVLTEDDELSGSIGQNALVVLPDQSALLSIVYLSSRLVHISLPGGEVREVDITDGDFADRLPPLSGADGMIWDDGTVLVAFTSELHRVTPTLGDWSTARTESVDVPGGQTDVVATPNGPYLLNGQAVDFALGRDPDPTRLVRFTEAL